MVHCVPQRMEQFALSQEVYDTILNDPISEDF